MKNKKLLLFLFLSLMTVSNIAVSAIEIEADEAVYNNKKGNSVYRGNVKITSDNLTLYGKEVEFFSKDGEISKIVSAKPPSRFVQRSASGSIRGKADYIEYLIAKELVHLRNNVRIKDKDKTFIGEDVIYNIKTQTFTSRKKGERIKLIIDSKKNKKQK